MSDTTTEAHRPIGGFVPKLVPAIIGAGLFGIVAVALFIRFFRARRPMYMLPVTIGAACMAIGFAIRAHMSSVGADASLGIYIAQTMFVLLSPCLYLAQDYMILPRLASWLRSEDLLFISPAKIVRFFVGSDVITFLLQAAGGGLSATGNPSSTSIGKWIALVGLILQCLSFTLFTLLWATLGWRLYDGYLMTHEGYFYALDAIPLLLAISLFVVVYPEDTLGSPSPIDTGLASPGSGMSLKPMTGSSDYGR